MKVMKVRSLFGFGISLAIVGAGSLPVFAQSQRYPTDAELRQLMGDFQRQIPFIDINPSLSEIESQKSFVSSWSQVDPVVAPFLGDWIHLQSGLSIFPSNVRGRVCLLHISYESENVYVDFEVASVSNDQIRTSGALGDSLIFRQGHYLGKAQVENNQPFIFAYDSYRAVELPTTESLPNLPQSSRIIQEFNNAGCTASLPQESQIAEGQAPQVPTWNKFVESGGADYFQLDFDLPQEFRNGYVYLWYGAHTVEVYIFKPGLPSYPVPTLGQLSQIEREVAEPYIQSGQAISLFLNLGFSGNAYANDTEVRFPERGRGCFRITCLTAPFLSNNEVRRILLSQRPIQQQIVWQQLKAFAQETQNSQLKAMVPGEFPNGFAQGQIAITAIKSDHISYVVAREGKTLTKLSTVGQQVAKPNPNFNAASSEDLDLPALDYFPADLYQAQHLIEVSRWASTYDSPSLRRQTQQSQQRILSDGRRSYYLTISGGKKAWCVFDNESAQSSGYTCVSIANSPVTAFGTLNLIAKVQSSEIATGRSHNTIESLPDGDYFYGQSTSATDYATYLIFRKRGNSIIGQQYDYPVEGACFQGQANQNRINNITTGYLNEDLDLDSGYHFVPNQNPIDLSSYYKLRFDQAPEGTVRGLQRCLQAFPNAEIATGRSQNTRLCSTDRIPVSVRTSDGQSPSYAGADKLGRNQDSKREDGSTIEADTRYIFFKTIANPPNYRQTWIIIHGWNNDSDTPDMRALAEKVAKQKKGDRVLMLDWGEAAYNATGESPVIQNISRGNYYAATWIRPVAEVAVQELKTKCGISDQEASTNLNLIGHSLGSIMSAEIGSIYKQGVNTIVALDPASEINAANIFDDLGGYDVDGRTPAYSFVYSFVEGQTRVPRPILRENIDRPKCFSNRSEQAARAANCFRTKVAQFSRAFVGKTSFAGNQNLAASADESFQMDFGIRLVCPGNEHGYVVRAFKNLISQNGFDGLLSLSDNRNHEEIQNNTQSYGHEGVIQVVIINSNQIDINDDIDIDNCPLRIVSERPIDQVLHSKLIPQKLYLKHTRKGDVIITAGGTVFSIGKSQIQPLADSLPVGEVGTVRELFQIDQPTP